MWSVKNECVENAGCGKCGVWKIKNTNVFLR